MKKKKLLLGLDPDLDFALDCFLAEHNAINKSSFIRDAIRARLKELTKPPEKVVSPPPRPNRAPKHPTLQEQWAAELRQENERRIQQALEPEHLDHQTQNWLRGR
jgi:hypothetical protein